MSSLPRQRPTVEPVGTELNENLEEFTVIWLDARIDTSVDCIDTKKHLQSIINYLKTFNDSAKCIDYIKAVKEEKVFLIVSGTYGEKVVPDIENLPQIRVVYVFCQNAEKHQKWASKHRIVQDIFTNKKKLYKQLTEDVRLSDASLLSIAILSPDSKENQVTDLNQQSVKYLWSQVLIEALLRFPNSKKAKSDMLKECRQQYYDNKREIDIIQEFDKEYYAENAIAWYTRECFLYKIVNKALRTDNIDVIFKFRFFIKDLYEELSKMHTIYIKSVPPTVYVYRGQYMTMKELTKLKENTHGHISMNTFLSTTVVLFEIEIDSTLATKPFANIKSKSCHKEENEVLIAMGSTFSIEKVEQDKQGIWNVNLVWSNKEDVELLTYMKKSLGQSTNLETLGSILIDMGELLKAERYFKLLLEQLPENHPSIGNTYIQMSTIGLNQSNIEKALEYSEKAEKIFQMSYPMSHPCYGSLYLNMGRIQLLQCDVISARLNLEKAAEMFSKNTPSYDLQLAAVYIQLGNISTICGEQSKMLTELKRGLEIQLKYLPNTHPDIGITYSYLGAAQLTSGLSRDALDSFTKSWEILRKSLSPCHPKYLLTCFTLSQLYDAKKDADKKNFYLDELFDNLSGMIAQNFGDIELMSLAASMKDGSATNQDMKILETRFKEMATPLERAVLEFRRFTEESEALLKKNDYDSALELINKTLLYWQQIIPSGTLFLAELHYKKAYAYFKKQDLVSALSSINGAIEILSSDFPRFSKYQLLLGDIYRDEGNQKMKLNELDAALVAHTKAVNIYIRYIQPPVHQTISNAYSTITKIHVRKHQFDLAKDNLFKARNSLPPNLLNSKHNLYNVERTVAYSIFRNSIKELINAFDSDALEGFQKALSTFTQEMSSLSFDIARTHFFIGYLYTNMANTSLAANHFHFALESAIPKHPIRKIAKELSSEIRQQTLNFILADLLLIYSKTFEPEYVSRLHERTIFYCQKYPTALSPVKLATIYLRIGSVYQKAKNDNLAKSYLNGASAVMAPDSKSIDKSEKIYFLELAEAQFKYADYCMAQSNFEAACPLFQKSLHIYKMLIPATDPKIIIIYRKLAGIYASRLEIPLAIRCLEKVVANPVNEEMYEEKETSSELSPETTNAKIFFQGSTADAETVTKVLKNITGSTVNFSIVSYEPNKYTARPHKGVLASHEILEVNFVRNKLHGDSEDEQEESNGEEEKYQFKIEWIFQKSDSKHSTAPARIKHTKLKCELKPS
ncbi:unnamed protein product [Rotaria socialis]|uniref:NAD(P)(+)--arginine ADP-ribosyltransferase n=1 Tax=Rotaria socialis TaxID=392032 RepID=A0A818FYH6_9BILA|nr:unnamed protein product [Rotaria socialis]